MLKPFRRWQLILLSAFCCAPAFAVDVRICTDFGAIDVALDERAAPLHAANFLRYTESGFYGGTVFHRVVTGSIVEGGSFDRRLQRRTPNATIADESGNGLSNLRGTIAAARLENADSASSQFFFNLEDNTHLDRSFGTPGYTVFGRVTAGLEILDQIAQLPSRRVENMQDVPIPLVEIQSVATIDSSPIFAASIEPDPDLIAARYEMARARGDAAGILDALDSMKRSCSTLSSSQRIVEAEAAIALGLVERARYGLETFLATANAVDPSRPVAERLYASLAFTQQSRTADELIGHCRAPAAPSIPNGRFTERATLQAVESAVLRFRQLGQFYLTCVNQQLARTDLDRTERNALTERHNDMVIELTAAAARFNTAVQNLQAAQRSGIGPN